MKQNTIDKLNSNPYYKDLPNGVDPEPEEDKEIVKTHGVVPKVATRIPKHVVEPRTVTHKKKKVDNENL